MIGYITRDKDADFVFLFDKCPTKNTKEEIWAVNGDSAYPGMSIDDENLPEGINPKWSDKEPIKVEILLKIVK